MVCMCNGTEYQHENSRTSMHAEPTTLTMQVLSIETDMDTLWCGTMQNSLYTKHFCNLLIISVGIVNVFLKNVLTLYLQTLSWFLVSEWYHKSAN